MKVYTIINIILSMLQLDPGGEKLANDHLPHLRIVAQQVSEVVRDMEATDEETRLLLAIGMRESRFGVPYSEYFPVSHAGACGIWQVKPRMTDYNESCYDFRDIYYAAQRSLEEIRYWRQKKGRLCHYNGGWKCRSAAKRYERDVKRYARKALAYNRRSQ